MRSCSGSAASGPPTPRRARSGPACARASRAELEPHFAQEERTLLPALTRLGLTEWVERTLSDHAQLRALCASTSGEFDRATLAAFGLLLWNHVRFEETVLFVEAQQRLSEHELAEVARAASGDPYGD